VSDKRIIIGHARHTLQAPHMECPAGFVPLRLRIEGDRTLIEIACPSAMVGRQSDADLRLAFADVSRRHARLAFENGLWRIHDLQSLNGILLNNKSIAEATLYTGDWLRIGCVELFVEGGTPKRVLLPVQEKPTLILDNLSAERRWD
jgi:pSer/pThr/pTyr-binding forkhead associated (FHA) protein